MESKKIHPVIWSRWLKKTEAMKSGRRWTEHSTVLSMDTPKGELKYRELKLDPWSPLLEKSIERGPSMVSRLDVRAAEILEDYGLRNNARVQATLYETAQTLKHTFDIIPANATDTTEFPLYIALHGGGGVTLPTLEENISKTDGYWYDMARNIYRNAVDKGIWVAIRGINEYWDLQFSPASYVLIERLIENMILFQGINSNRVYLIGFSAGGDGVFRLAPRLSQRFAASNMGGGDPGDADKYFANLINSPICLRVGAWDDLVYRCMKVGKAGSTLDDLQQNFEKLHGDDTTVYDHDTYIHLTDRFHPNRNNYKTEAEKNDADYEWKHNSWDDISSSWSDGGSESQRSAVVSKYKDWWPKYRILTDVPEADRDKYLADMNNFLDENKTSVNTNVVEWFKRHRSRDPKSLNMVWNTEIRAPASNDNFSRETLLAMSAPSQNSWLDIGPDPADKAVYDLKVRSAAEVGSEIRVRIDKGSRIIFVDGAKSYLRIFLHPDMLDLSRWISVRIGDQRIPVAVGTTPNIAVIDYTLARNDPHLAFTADIVLRQDTLGKWTAAPTPLTSR